MSVKIEILDYNYGAGDNLVNVNAATPVAGWTANNSTSASWDGSGGGITYLSGISSQSLVIGATYNLFFNITGKTGTSDMGFSTSSGVPIAARSSVNGSFSFTFVATGTSFPDLFGRNTNTGTISSIVITDASVIDWDKSIVGELDVTDHSDFPIALTFQISDFRDLTSTSGDYSKTFKIPATKNNNNLLKHLYIPNINSDNKVTDKKPCRILFNNLYSLVGLIQVDGVGGYGETPSYYSCVFFGSNLSWADKIQDTYMNTIDWGANGEGLTYNKNSIVDTWDDIDCTTSDSPIVYPVTSYGDYNALGTARTIQLLDTITDALGYIATKVGYYGFNDAGTDYGTPSPVADWRPSVFVKTTLDKIFSTIGYKINSAFMSTDMFKKLVWLLPNFKYNNPDDRTIQYGYGNRFTGEGLISTETATASNGNTFVSTFFTINLNDSSDFVLDSTTANTGWDAATGVFTVQEYGEYKIKLDNLGIYWDNLSGSGSSSTTTVDFVKLSLQIQTVGQSSWNTISYHQSSLFSASTNNNTINGTINFGSLEITRFFNKDDELRLIYEVSMNCNAGSSNSTSLDFHLFGSSTPTSATNSSNANATYTIAIDPLFVEYGQTYDLSEVMNTDYKQIDFIKGIAHAFNLQMTTDESTKTINIEPFDTFYKPYADAIDWTYKLDRSKETSDKWLQSDLKRTLVFKYKNDSADSKVKNRGEQFFHKIEDEYPYKETLPNTFKKGDSTFENPFFAGTYNGKDQDTTFVVGVDTAYSGVLWTEDFSVNELGRPVKGYDFLPRLLYWNKYSPSNSNIFSPKQAVVQTWSSVTKVVKAWSGLPSSAGYGIYPQATMINRDSTISPNLAYGNVWVRDYDDDTGVYTSYQVGKGLYDTYYRNMIEGLKRSPRLRTVSVSLNTTDIVNLDFKKLVYIDGVYWRVNKIIDFKPNKNESTKVELIEWFQIGEFSATSPMFGSSGDNDWNSDGSIIDNDNSGL